MFKPAPDDDCVLNWSAYDAALREGGLLMVWFGFGDALVCSVAGQARRAVDTAMRLFEATKA